MQTSSEVLALDVGGRRIGVAIANTIARIPSVYTTLEQNNNILEQIKEIIQKENISFVVVGYPRSMSGQITEQTRITEEFAGKLAKHTGLDVVFQDETLTSVKARDELEARGAAYSKGDIDALAAVYILQDYLNEHVG